MIVEKAYAKLNLSLDILRRREDGYHDLSMVMQTIDVADSLRVIFDGDSYSFRCNWPDLKTDQSNLVTKAMRLFSEETGADYAHTQIYLEKGIPSGAGMAGGSADAAAMLRVLRQHFAPKMPMEILYDLALQVGSDVPFCLEGGTQLAEGRGEQLTKLPALPTCSIIVCKPNFSISTPDLYGRVKVSDIKDHPKTQFIMQALQNENITDVACSMKNVFEPFLQEKESQIFELENAIREHGALNAIMTGSGSAVFGIFDDNNKAKIAYSSLKELVPYCFLTKPQREVLV